MHLMTRTRSGVAARAICGGRGPRLISKSLNEVTYNSTRLPEFTGTFSLFLHLTPEYDVARGSMPELHLEGQ